MNFEYMPELSTRYGYFGVLTAVCMRIDPRASLWA